MSMKTGKALIVEIDATAVGKGQCALWWLGQHGFAVKLGQTVLYIDAYLSQNWARNVRPLLLPSEVTNADAIIGTHDHADHIDRPVWPEIANASPGAMFLAPQFVRDDLVSTLGLPAARVVGLDDGVSATVGDVEITAIPAAHELLSTDPVTGANEFLGVIIEGNGFCLYHAGDTCLYEGLHARLRTWNLDLALLPINGRDAKRLSSGCIGNMTYQEAVDLAGAIKPGLTIPTHFEMFDGNTENPQLFSDYIQVKYPALKAQVPVHGERLLIDTAAAR